MALGRGLGALITQPEEQNNSSVGSETTSNAGNVEIDIDLIDANPNQPRTTFDEESLDELSASIKVHGIIQPLTLRLLENGRYQIISGERRFRASKIAGLTSVPAYIRTANDQETLEMALIENIQREDLDAMEVAFTYQRLIEECSLTQEALSERVGKKRTTVTNYLRLLNLPFEIQEMIRDRKISMGHARSLVSIEDKALQKSLARKVIEQELSVRQVEELVKKINSPKQDKVKKEEGELPEKYCTLVELLELYFNNKIHIKRNEKGEGSITISFSSDEDVAKFIENLSNLT